ncbi:putative bifunctional diguanylate cyclase/phosphodiesterase [Methylobacterium iners]
MTTPILASLLPAAIVSGWLLVLVLVSLRRYLVLRHAVEAGVVEDRPDLALTLTAAGAAFAGLTWAALPMLCDAINSEHPSILLFVLSGLAAGAVALSPTHALTSMAFALPILMSTAAGRLLIGDSMSLLFAVVTVFFTLMLARSALLAERTFCEGSRTKHAATALAAALSRAKAEIEAKAEMLGILASQDALTGLSNRTAFSQGIADRLGEVNDRRGALLLLDLDNFKLVNDTLGHGSGDDLLVQVADRLREAVGEDALASRLGGDEFAILIDDGTPPEEVASRILDRVTRPLMIGGRSASIGVSIGIACFPDHGRTTQDLMLRADLALYAAKAGGRQRFYRFDSSLQHAVAIRRDIELDLANALAEGEIEAWCQPQLSLSDRSIVGVELLIRWKHERHGWIAPPDIVAAAVSTRQSEALTLHVVSEACRLIRDLQSQGHPDVTVAVNVSPQELGSYPLAERIAERLVAFGVSARSLEIEITEEAALAGESATREINAVSALGLRIAIDDFKAGYSSLASLRALHVERIKIDRSFVTNMAVQEGNRVLVQAILGIGRALGLEVVAEGVESMDDALLLTRYGCHIAQGYHLARPMPRRDLDTWIEARGTNVASEHAHYALRRLSS